MTVFAFYIFKLQKSSKSI